MSVFKVRKRASAKREPARGKVSELCKEARHLLDMADQLKERLYGRLEEITLALKDEDIARYGLAVVDNFADRNTVFRTTSVKRYEMKVIK